MAADDYIVKPFSPCQLSARIRARLRCFPDKEKAPVLHSGSLEACLLSLSPFGNINRGQPQSGTPALKGGVLLLLKKFLRVHNGCKAGQNNERRVCSG